MSRLTAVMGDAIQKTTQPSVALQRADDMEQALKTRLLPGLGLAGAGAFVWKKHRVLGGLLGLAVGDSVYPLIKGQGTERADAAVRVGASVAAVAASLAWKKHPVWGYILGSLVASAALSVVPGTSSYRDIVKSKGGA